MKDKLLGYLLVFFLLVSSINTLNKRKPINGACSIEQAHITFGDKFSVSGAGQNVWTISFVSKDGCKSSEVQVKLSDGSILQPAVKNNYYNDEKSYDAAAFFFYVTQDHLQKAGAWQASSPSNTLGPFFFPRTAPKKETSSSKWLIIADMDESSYSEPTLARLTELAKQGTYDGLIHNGDYAYNIQTSKGKVGDSYFKSFSPVSARIPYVVTPGNHEDFDSFKMFNYRFQMPGAPNGLTRQAANYYSFIVKGIYFVSINWDYAFTKEGQNNFKEVFNWLAKELQAAESNPLITKRVFFTHKPFFCTFVDEDCLNFYLFKPVESLLYKHRFDLILHAHVHLYYRHKKIDKNFKIVDDSARVPATYISGHQGVDPERGGNTPIVPDTKKGMLEKVALAGSPNLLELESDENGLQLTLRDCASFNVLDRARILSRPTVFSS